LLVVLGVLVALVVLIACVNVANMMAAQAAALLFCEEPSCGLGSLLAGDLIVVRLPDEGADRNDTVG
jgi:hypothetical protein